MISRMPDFAALVIFIKSSPSRATAGFNKIAKVVEDGVLMIIHIYAKAYLYKMTYFSPKIYNFVVNH